MLVTVTVTITEEPTEFTLFDSSPISLLALFDREVNSSDTLFDISEDSALIVSVENKKNPENNIRTTIIAETKK